LSNTMGTIRSPDSVSSFNHDDIRSVEIPYVGAVTRKPVWRRAGYALAVAACESWR